MGAGVSKKSPTKQGRKKGKKKTRKLLTNEVKLRLILRYEIRSLFGVGLYHRQGYFLDHPLTVLIKEYLHWIDYPIGNHRLMEHTSHVNASVVSSDGQFLFTGGSDFRIIKWNLKDYSIHHDWKAHNNWVSCLDHHYHSGFLVSGGYDSKVKLWNDSDNHIHDIHGNDLRYTLVGHSTDIRDVKFNTLGSLIISACSDTTLRLWSVENGQCLKIFRGHQSTVSGVAFIDDRFLLSCSDDRLMKVWDISNSKPLRSTAESRAGSMKCLSFSADGLKVAVSGRNCVCIVKWPSLDEKSAVFIDEETSCLCFHPENPDILALGYRTLVKLIDLRNLECIDYIDEGSTAKSTLISQLCFTPKGERLISVSLDSSVCLFDLSSVEIL